MTLNSITELLTLAIGIGEISLYYWSLFQFFGTRLKKVLNYLGFFLPVFLVWLYIRVKPNDLNIIITNVTYIVVAFVFFDGNYCKKFLSVTALLCSAIAIDYCVLGFISLSGMTFSSEQTSFLYLVWSFCARLIWMTLLRCVIMFIKFRQRGIDFFNLFIPFCLLSCFNLFVIISIFTNQNLNESLGKEYFAYLFCLVAIYYVVQFNWQSQNIKMIALKNDQLIYKEQLEYQSRTISEIQKMRAQYIDLRHKTIEWLMVIYNMHYNDDDISNKEVMKVLKNAANDLCMIKTSEIKSRNSLIATVVSYKLSILEKRGISFDTHLLVPDGLNLNENDFACMVAYAIDCAAVFCLDGGRMSINTFRIDTFLKIVILCPTVGKNAKPCLPNILQAQCLKKLVDTHDARMEICNTSNFYWLSIFLSDIDQNLLHKTL